MLTGRQLAIMGSGGHAVSLLDACLSLDVEVIAFVDSQMTQETVSGVPVVHDLSEVEISSVGIALGIGHNFVRERVLREIRERFPQAHFPVIVHSSAWVSPAAQLAEATVVLSHSSVGPSAKTGIGALLNTGSSLDHEAILGDFASLGPGARVAGRASIGARAMIGLNAGIMQDTSVGDDTVIGAASLVRNDIEPGQVAFGIPCVPRRNRLVDEPYY